MLMYVSYLRNFSGLSLVKYFENLDKEKFKFKNIEFETELVENKINITFFRLHAPYPYCKFEISEICNTNLLEVKIYTFTSNSKKVKSIYGKFVKYLDDIYYINNFILLLSIINNLKYVVEEYPELKNIGILFYHLICFEKRSQKTILAKFGNQISMDEFFKEIKNISYITFNKNKKKFLPYVISFSINNRFFSSLSAKRGLIFINEEFEFSKIFLNIIRNEVLKIEKNTIKERILKPKYIQNQLYSNSYVCTINRNTDYSELISDISTIADGFKYYGTKTLLSKIGNPITRIYLEDKDKAMDLLTIIKEKDDVHIMATPMNILRDYITTFTLDVIKTAKIINKSE